LCFTQLIIDNTVNVSVITTQAALSAERLSHIWGIGLEAAKCTLAATTAKCTLAATTQKAVITVAFRNVERQWPTGDRALRYRRLNHKVFYDTVIASVESQRNNKLSEIYVTDVGWSRN
jgi:hypothetical protein